MDPLIQKYLQSKYLDQLTKDKESKELQNEYADNNMFRGFDTIGAALAGTPNDDSFYNNLDKQAKDRSVDSKAKRDAVNNYLMETRKLGAEEAKQKLELDKFGLDGKKADETSRHNKVMEGLERSKSAKEAGLSPGEKAADVDFGKSLTEWTTSGRAGTDKNLTRLEEAKKALMKGTSGLLPASGPIVGNLSEMELPFVGRSLGRVVDVARGQDAIRIRDDVRAAAQGALKATLGSQFTEKEGQRIMEQAYNEKLSPEENIKKIDAAIKEIQDIRAAKEKQVGHFKQKGSLKGYQDQPKVQTMIKDGVTYKKVPGGWESID